MYVITRATPRDLHRDTRVGSKTMDQTRLEQRPGSVSRFGAPGRRPKACGLVCVLEHGPGLRAVHSESHREDLQLHAKEPIGHKANADARPNFYGPPARCLLVPFSPERNPSRRVRLGVESDERLALPPVPGIASRLKTIFERSPRSALLG